MEDFIRNIAIGAPGFLLAIVCHEWAHAWMAKKFGDQTAQLSGRLTLNPAAHIDVFGTLLFPLIGAAVGGFMFGWAKPVPVNSGNFKNIRKGIFWVSFAGPGMNIILGSFSCLFYVLVRNKVSSDFYLQAPFVQMLYSSIYINFILAVFNLIPFPPLDGSKMVSSFLDYEKARRYEELGRYSFYFFLGLMILSHMGVPIFNLIFAPAVIFANVLISGFNLIF